MSFMFERQLISAWMPKAFLMNYLGMNVSRKTVSTIQKGFVKYFLEIFTRKTSYSSDAHCRKELVYLKKKEKNIRKCDRKEKKMT